MALNGMEQSPPFVLPKTSNPCDDAAPCAGLHRISNYSGDTVHSHGPLAQMNALPPPAVQMDDHRYHLLSKEFAETIEINAQLTCALNDLREVRRSDAGERDTLLHRLSKAACELDGARAEIDLLTSRCRETLSRFDESQAAVSNLTSMLSSARADAHTFQSQAHDFGARLEACTAALADLERRNSDLSSNNDKLSRCASWFASQLSELTDRMRLGRKCGADEWSASCPDSTENSFSSADASLSILRSQIDSMEIRNNSLAQSLAAANERLVLSEETVAQQSRQLEAMESCTEQAVADRIAMENAQTALEALLAASKAEVASLQGEVEAKTSAMTDYDARLGALQRQLDALSDAARAAEDVLVQRGDAMLDGQSHQLSSTTAKLLQLTDDLRSRSERVGALESQISEEVSKREKLSALLEAQRQESAVALETNTRLAAAASECQLLLAAFKEDTARQLTSKDHEMDALRSRLAHYESELGHAVQELDEAKKVISSHMHHSSLLAQDGESKTLALRQCEIRISSAEAKNTALVRDLDAQQDQIARLESLIGKRDEEKRILQIEILQMRNALKKEQEEVRSITAVHQSMRESFENRARQNQDVVNGADARAAELEAELSAVISKYNSLAQSHKELRLRFLQTAKELDISQNSNVASQSESEAISRQRRVLFELNLKLSEQETIIRDLSAANVILSAITPTDSHANRNSYRGVLSVQPLNVSEGPIRHPKRLRIDKAPQ